VDGSKILAKFLNLYKRLDVLIQESTSNSKYPFYSTYFRGLGSCLKVGGQNLRSLKVGQKLIFHSVEIDFQQKVGGQLPPLAPKPLYFTFLK